MAKCDCGALIVWVKTEHAAMPLDAHEAPKGPRSVELVPTPFENGNVVLDRGVARVVSPGPGQFRAHFVECPNAAKHRRR